MRNAIAWFASLQGLEDDPGDLTPPAEDDPNGWELESQLSYLEGSTRTDSDQECPAIAPNLPCEVTAEDDGTASEETYSIQLPSDMDW